MLHDSDKAANDYNYSRETYYDLIEKGKSALDDMIEVARESEHPRAFEVLSGMIKNISDVNDRLMILNKGKMCSRFFSGYFLNMCHCLFIRVY